MEKYKLWELRNRELRGWNRRGTEKNRENSKRWHGQIQGTNIYGKRGKTKADETREKEYKKEQTWNKKWNEQSMGLRGEEHTLMKLREKEQTWNKRKVANNL